MVAPLWMHLSAFTISAVTQGTLYCKDEYEIWFTEKSCETIPLKVANKIGIISSIVRFIIGLSQHSSVRSQESGVSSQEWGVSLEETKVQLIHTIATGHCIAVAPQNFVNN